MLWVFKCKILCLERRWTSFVQSKMFMCLESFDISVKFLILIKSVVFWYASLKNWSFGLKKSTLLDPKKCQAKLYQNHELFTKLVNKNKLTALIDITCPRKLFLSVPLFQISKKNIEKRSQIAS